MVDDQAGVRRLLYEVLKDDCEVYLASSGEEAVQQAREKSPAVVLMDVRMPGMNGIETLRQLRELSYSGPVVLMTAYGESELVSQADLLGATCSIAKPFDVFEVRDVVRDLLPEAVAVHDVAQA